MRDKEIVGLYQAYLDVYSNLNEEVEQLDEISPERIARGRHGRMQNLNKAEAEEMRARDAGATMGELSRLSANTSKAADRVSRNRRLSSAHARSRVRMNKEEVENWVNSLIEEGYDLSEYTWDDMYEMYVNLDEAEIMKHQKERSAIERRKKMKGYEPPTTGVHGEIERRQAQKPPSKLRSGSLPESFDLFDIILEHLVVEGYADTNESAIAIMSNMSEEWRQDIMEISRKTATSAFAKSATGEFEGADSDHDIRRTENLGKHIERKFGKKALEDAESHADSSTFGRKDPRTGKRQPRPQSRFQKPNKYRTRADGKMHGQDQNTLKAKLQKRRPSDSDN